MTNIGSPSVFFFASGSKFKYFPCHFLSFSTIFKCLFSQFLCHIRFGSSPWPPVQRGLDPDRALPGAGPRRGLHVPPHPHILPPDADEHPSPGETQHLITWVLLSKTSGVIAPCTNKNIKEFRNHSPHLNPV